MTAVCVCVCVRAREYNNMNNAIYRQKGEFIGAFVYYVYGVLGMGIWIQLYNTYIRNVFLIYKI